MSEQAHADNLKASRAGSLKNSLQNAKKNIDAAKNVGSLLAHIDPIMDWLFAIAMCAAILKDIMDLFGNALLVLGGLGEILIFIFTTMASLIIGLVMVATGSTGKTKIAKKVAKRIMLLIAATIVEYIPGVDILPIETALVIVIVWMTLVERKVNADTEKENKQDSTKQLGGSGATKLGDVVEQDPTKQKEVNNETRLTTRITADQRQNVQGE